MLCFSLFFDLINPPKNGWLLDNFVIYSILTPILEGGGAFQWVTLHVLEIKKIYQRIVNNVILSVLKLETRYLHESIQGYKPAILSETPPVLEASFI